jgi:hypothetical protein
MLLPRPPTSVRFMNDAEWEIVTRVFTPARLPWRMQILVTNGTGPQGSNMAIPSALLGSFGQGLSALPGGLAGFALGGPIGAMIGAFLGALSGALTGYLVSAGPQAYFLLVGPTGYAGMEKTKEASGWLVHETAHVWQGKASWFAMSYLYDSVYCQFKAMLSGGDPYRYDFTQPWSSFNAEQKAQIVQDWFTTGESTASSNPFWPFVRDYVRKGIP